jgi:hypothetical protein
MFMQLMQRLVGRFHNLEFDDENGMATAELLANAALGVAALVVIWVALQAVGVNVVTYIGNALNGGK